VSPGVGKLEEREREKMKNGGNCGFELDDQCERDLQRGQQQVP
jgi:hypothetical protein